MGEIKSALEIAFERTKDVSADKKLVKIDSSIKEGKKIISKFLDDSSVSLDGCFKNIEQDQIGNVRKGMFQVLMQNLVLPKEQFAIKKINRVAEGFFKIITDVKRIKGMMTQLEGFFTEYLSERERIKEIIDKQFAKRLEAKEEALSKQLGSPVRLNPASDPEYNKYMSQAYGQLEQRYNDILTQVKEELERLFKAGKK
ncbi:MAG: hypothetical protein JW969_18175 [Spirochaetales bacterium]|nr:hypothetical protein [Spirochaetales bacterium]